MSRLFLVFALLFTLTACGAPDAGEPTAETAESPTAEAPTEAPSTDSGADSGSVTDTCAALTPEEVAAALGADPAAVTQEPGEAARFSKGLGQDCNSTVQHEGIETTVTLYALAKNENHADDAWARRLQGYQDDGEEIGSKTYTYEPTPLGGMDNALLSNIEGSAYVKLRMAVWQRSEEQFFRMTVVSTLEGDVESVPDPSAELFDQLIAAAMN